MACPRSRRRRDGELEEVDAVAVVVHDLEQADDLARRARRAAARAAGRAAPARPALVGQMDLGDHRVDLVDQREEGRVAVLARVRERVRRSPRVSLPGFGAHDDDAVAEEDGLLDQVRDEQHALAGPRSPRDQSP